MERIIDNPDEKTWGMLCHLSAFAGAVIPFGNIAGPLVVYSIKRTEYDFVDDQGKESLNFQITMTIAILIASLLMFVLVGFVLLPIIGIYAIVYTIVGAIKANNGEFFRYPITYRFIK